MASWSICSTVKEPQAVLDRFVRHHLDAGAAYVHLFFDDPEDPAFRRFERHDLVVAELCDDKYWSRFGRRRPPQQERRQKLNAARAYQLCQTAWQAHIDADELIVPPSKAGLTKVLARIPNQIETLKMDPMEPLYCPEPEHDGALFKKTGRSTRHRVLARTFGIYLPLLNHGLMGHCHGKSFLRAGLDGWSHGIHRPRPPEGEMRNALLLDTINIAHLHCADRTDWLHRVTRKAKDPQYSAGGALPLVRDIRACHGPEADNLSDARLLGHFYDRVNGYHGKLKRRLDRANLVTRCDLNCALPELSRVAA